MISTNQNPHLISNKASAILFMAAFPLLPALAGLAARRQPTPAFPQPNAPLALIPAVHRHKRAPDKRLPAANNGGYSATRAI